MCACYNAGFHSSRTLIPVPTSSQQAPLYQNQVSPQVLALSPWLVCMRRGGPVGSSWVQCVEHIGAQLRCSFPALVMPEPGSEGAVALVGLGPTATIPQPQAVMAECWGCYWRALVALRSGCRRGCEDPVLCPSHLGHCWLGLLGDTGFSSNVLSTSLAVLAPCRVPTTSVGQGRVMGWVPLSRTAGILVLCMGDPLGTPCRDDLPLACPSCPPRELAGGPAGASAREQPPQRAGTWAAAGRRPPRQLRAGIELLCLKPFRR